MLFLNGNFNDILLNVSHIKLINKKRGSWDDDSRSTDLRPLVSFAKKSLRCLYF